MPSLSSADHSAPPGLLDFAGKVRSRKGALPLAVLLACLCLAGCGQRQGVPTVVVYTAHDQIYSEPVLRKFEQENGIRVLAVYDTEATKTVGLVNRLMAEQGHPQCDVWWNNETVRTVLLKRQGALQSSVSPSSADIPAAMKDPEGAWTGFAARARVLVYNTNLLKRAEVPGSLLELTNARWQGRVALAYPLFGTTATHAAALFVAWGDAAAQLYFQALRSNQVVIVDGNAAVKDIVARGEVPLGVTDTDDAFIALQQGQPVAIVFPDQQPGQMGALVIPNTAALVKNSPHPDAARKLLDYLLRRDTEQMLAHSGSAQMPVRAGIPVPPGVPRLDSVKPMTVDWERVADKVAESSWFLSALFVR